MAKQLIRHCPKCKSNLGLVLTVSMTNKIRAVQGSASNVSTGFGGHSSDPERRPCPLHDDRGGRPKDKRHERQRRLDLSKCLQAIQSWRDRLMLIEVSYQGASESRDIYAHVKRTDYFETDDMPSRKAVARKLTADIERARIRKRRLRGVRRL